MTDHRGKKMKVSRPGYARAGARPRPGAPQAGDRIQVMETEREARELATQRQQLAREQSIRTKKHITLDEIGRRLAIGSFKELNILVKGDVDGSVEALSDSLLKLSTPEVKVNILRKGVGAISESDVLLASASDAIIIGFQVRPSQSARKLAEQEQIDMRLYSHHLQRHQRGEGRDGRHAGPDGAGSGGGQRRSARRCSTSPKWVPLPAVW
ncbi:MAG: hypothetical protein WKG07_34315 [Hymenobacter sp.]